MAGVIRLNAEGLTSASTPVSYTHLDVYKRQHIDGVGGTCHGFIAIDPKVFGNPEDIEAHFSTFLQELRDAPKAKGQSRIYTHGEKEIEAVKDRMENGIDVDVKTVLEMKDLSNYVGVDFEKYFGKLDIEDDGYKTVY